MVDQLNILETLEDLHEQYGNGLYTLPDGESVTLNDAIQLSDVVIGDCEGISTLVEWSAPNVAVLTHMVDGYREESLGRIEFEKRPQPSAREREIEVHGRAMAEVARLLEQAHAIARKHSTAGHSDYVTSNIAYALAEARRRAGDYLKE